MCAKGFGIFHRVSSLADHDGRQLEVNETPEEDSQEQATLQYLVGEAWVLHGEIGRAHV